MSLPKVYLETSFISYLATALQQRNSSNVNTAHRQLSSLRWWTKHKEQFELFISEAVLKECSIGHDEAARNRLQVLTSAEMLFGNHEIIELTAQLVEPVLDPCLAGRKPTPRTSRSPVCTAVIIC